MTYIAVVQDDRPQIDTEVGAGCHASAEFGDVVVERPLRSPERRAQGKQKELQCGSPSSVFDLPLEAATPPSPPPPPTVPPPALLRGAVAAVRRPSNSGSNSSRSPSPLSVSKSLAMAGLETVAIKHAGPPCSGTLHTHHCDPIAGKLVIETSCQFDDDSDDGEESEAPVLERLNTPLLSPVRAASPAVAFFSKTCRRCHENESDESGDEDGQLRSGSARAENTQPTSWKKVRDQCAEFVQSGDNFDLLGNRLLRLEIANQKFIHELVMKQLRQAGADLSLSTPVTEFGLTPE